MVDIPKWSGAGVRGYRVPAPVSSEEYRHHLRFEHGLYLESWVVLSGDHGMIRAHELAHGERADSMVFNHIPHWHSDPEPPEPVPDVSWW